MRRGETEFAASLASDYPNCDAAGLSHEANMAIIFNIGDGWHYEYR